jgi:oligosaccharide repeat unit polymerase
MGNIRLLYKRIINLSIFVLIICLLSMLYTLGIIELNTILQMLIVFLATEKLIRAFIFSKVTDVFSPQVVVPFLFMFYIFGPLIEDKGHYNYYKQYDEYLFLNLLGLVALKIGLSYNRNSFTQKEFQENEDIFLRKILYSASLLLLISIPSIITYIFAFGGIENLIAVGYGGEKFQVIKSSFIFGNGFEWILLSSLLYIFYGLKAKKNRFCLLGLTILSLFLYIILLVGGRSIVTYCILFFLIVYHYGYRKLPNRTVIILMVLGISLAQFYSFARFYLDHGLIQALIDTGDVLKNNPELFVPWAANEFKKPNESMLEILKYGGPGIKWGSTYLLSIGAVFPIVTRLFAQVGFNPSEWRLQTFYPEILAQGGGLGFSPVSEGYINFGFLGIVIHMFFYGLIIKRIYLLAKSSPNSSYILLYAGALPLFMLDGLRIHSASMVYKLFRVYLVPWILYIIISFLGKKTSGRGKKIEDKSFTCHS